jgi:dolichol-phosphate mannosyltransferase
MTSPQLDPGRRPLGTVLVPAYNESSTIRTSIEQIAAVLTTELSDRAWEIIVVDDGSADSTAVLAAGAAVELRSDAVDVRVLRHHSNRGLGGALQTGFALSQGDVVVVVDCDLSYHPNHIPALVRAWETDHADIAVASPYMSGGRTVAVPGSLERRSRMANRFLALLSRSPLATFTGMVRAYDSAFIRALALRSSDDMINVEALYKASLLNGRVVEVPATLDWRGLDARASRTSLRSKRSRRKIYETLVHGLLYRPYLPFALGGVLITLVGSALGLIAALLPGSQIGLTVLGVSLMIAGFSAILASVLSVQVKRGFEDLFFQQSPARQLIRAVAPVGVANVVEMAIRPDLEAVVPRESNVTEIMPGVVGLQL